MFIFPIRKHIISFLQINAIALLFVPAFLWAQQNPIKSLDIRSEKNRILSNSHFKNMLDEEMRATIASGMSTTLEMHFTLKNLTNKTFLQHEEIIILRYNVWEKVYTIIHSSAENQFTDTDHFERFLNDSLSFRLWTTSNIPQNNELQIFISFSPGKISDTQKSKLDQWLKNEDEISEGRPALEAEPAFSINLSGLLSIFLNKKENQTVYFFKTAPFTLQSIQYQ